MNKKIGLILGVVLFAFALWYLLFKPYDYLATITTKASIGAINQSIKLWSKSQDSAELLEQENLAHFKHRIQFNDSIYTYEWKIAKLNDSTSKIKVLVKDIDHSFKNRLTMPFTETHFEKRTKNTLIAINDLLKEHLRRFKVTVIGIDDMPSKYCACVPLKGAQSEKASGMMQNYSLLSQVLAKNSVALDGSPLIEVKTWDMIHDSISYNFCFPIIKSDSLPQIAEFEYKQLQQKKAIKAIYNGNYITSDRAWYALLEYAEKNNIAVEKKPLEIFHTNPNIGGDELKWEAEIYMPLKE